MPPSPQYMSYEEIRAEADAFLAEYWPSGAIPVDIDKIVDVHLGIDVVPVPYLLDDSEIDGFLSADRKTIYVDEFVYERRLHRYRFTLAHEIGHLWLHGELYEDASFSTAEEWRDYVESIPQQDYGRWEHQAYCFAGLILVPRDPLAEKVVEAMEMARAAGHEPDVVANESDRLYLAEWVGRRFEVSADVILRRGGYDDLWPK